ncbi:MAG: aminoglycoside 3'-phosphotransferase [Lachnospiraceae bacterium]|nr:aminoglycoside 3'-phosphotransferase [Lachnospiraceae bacterium]
MELPKKIVQLISGESYQTDEIGMSDSAVLLFKDKVLKVQVCGEEAGNEYELYKWLKGKLPVPQILAYEVEGNRAFLLMSKCHGKMSCDEAYMRDPRRQIRLLAKALKQLWRVDIQNCPCDNRLEQKLRQARFRVEHDLVDIDNVEPDTFGEGGFRDPADLLQWLFAHRPKEEPVLSHGDFCLPNIFLDGDEVAGYIDLGRGGIADKWCDIALCYRSLSHNYSGKYQKGISVGQSYPDYDDLLLFKELGIEPDWEKIRYYILLDELF